MLTLGDAHPWFKSIGEPLKSSSVAVFYLIAIQILPSAMQIREVARLALEGQFADGAIGRQCCGKGAQNPQRRDK